MQLNLKNERKQTNKKKHLARRKEKGRGKKTEKAN